MYDYLASRRSHFRGLPLTVNVARNGGSQLEFYLGRQLSDHGNITFPLKSDDPSALRIICNALHSKPTTERLSLPLVIQAAEVCDYYDLSQALETWSKQWILWEILSTEADVRAKMVAVSHAFNNEDIFYWQSLRLLCKSTASDFEVFEQNCFTICFPERLIGDQQPV